MTEQTQSFNFEEESVDFKAYFFKLLRFWYVFPITILISLVIAVFVIKTTTPIYKVGAKLLVKDEQSLMDPKVILQNTSNPFSIGDYKIRNEIEILNSYSLVKRTVSELNFSVSYYLKDQFRDIELYTNTPFVINYDSSHVQPINTSIFLKKIDNNQYHIWFEAERVGFYTFNDNKYQFYKDQLEFNDTISRGELLRNELMKFRINEKRELETDKVYMFQFRSPESVIAQFRDLHIQNIDNSSVITLRYDGPNVQKSIDFLNKYIEVYLNRGVEKKNQVAINTIEFINSQIYKIADSLRNAESQLEDYRASQKVMDINFQSQQVYENLEDLQNQKAELLLRQQYLTYLQGYLSEKQDYQDLIAPSSMGIEDGLLNSLIMELTKLYAEKVDVMVNSKKDNPYLESVKAKIENQKRTLEENVQSSLKRATISLNDINERIAKLTNEVQALPGTQRKLFSYEREFRLQDAIYTYLLKKKSEMQIAKASNIAENEIIDYPKLMQKTPQSPNKRNILMVAFLIGLGLPVAAILLFDYFNDKVEDLSDVERIIDRPVLGNILHSKDSSPFVLQHNPNSVVAESFRSLRTNFQYILGETENPVIMVTSTMMAEGKSFVSTNLATSFALYKKKVLLLSFDLRRPTVSKLFDLNKKEGLSNYLSSNSELKDIIFKTEIPDLYVIPTGPIPPNPSELIAATRTKELFHELRKKFDYIIVDTPPIGIVSDALLLERYVDKSLFIIRHNYSRKRMLSHLFASLEKKNIKDINLVVNDINMKKVGYSYNYAYGYGYSYHEK